MNRRNAIKNTAMIMGYAVSASAIMGVLNGCKAEPSPTGWKPIFFNDDQVQLVAEIADQILPATDTPGAKDVFVHRFMDQMLKDNYTPLVQKRFQDGLKTFSDECQSTFKKSFFDCTPEERKQLLTKYDEQAFAAKEKIEAEQLIEKERFQKMEKEFHTGEGYRSLNRSPFFSILKELTLLGYFTSEKIGMEVLNYDPVPGNYDGCIPLPENGRIWSL